MSSDLARILQDAVPEPARYLSPQAVLRSARRRRTVRRVGAAASVVSILGALSVGIVANQGAKPDEPVRPAVAPPSPSERDGYSVNSRGQTYGKSRPDAHGGAYPDLSLSEGKNGTKGYALLSDLRKPMQLKPGEKASFPLYDQEGRVVVGELEVTAASPAPQFPRDPSVAAALADGKVSPVEQEAAAERVIACVTERFGEVITAKREPEGQFSFRMKLTGNPSENDLITDFLARCQQTFLHDLEMKLLESPSS